MTALCRASLRSHRTNMKLPHAAQAEVSESRSIYPRPTVWPLAPVSRLAYSKVCNLAERHRRHPSAMQPACSPSNLRSRVAMPSSPTRLKHPNLGPWRGPSHELTSSWKQKNIFELRKLFVQGDPNDHPPSWRTGCGYGTGQDKLIALRNRSSVAGFHLNFSHILPVWHRSGASRWWSDFGIKCRNKIGGGVTRTCTETIDIDSEGGSDVIVEI